ncbi:MAG: endonuclease domain-containing protein [Rhodobacterales bacterium]
MDYCHSTGAFRGFLCRNCNTGLGAFRDRPLILIRAAFYLVKNRIWVCTYTSFNRLKLLGISG